MNCELKRTEETALEENAIRKAASCRGYKLGTSWGQIWSENTLVSFSEPCYKDQYWHYNRVGQIIAQSTSKNILANWLVRSACCKNTIRLCEQHNDRQQRFWPCICGDSSNLGLGTGYHTEVCRQTQKYCDFFHKKPTKQHWRLTNIQVSETCRYEFLVTS